MGRPWGGLLSNCTPPLLHPIPRALQPDATAWGPRGRTPHPARETLRKLKAWFVTSG